jgi:hypothetical protein
MDIARTEILFVLLVTSMSNGKQAYQAIVSEDGRSNSTRREFPSALMLSKGLQAQTVHPFNKGGNAYRFWRSVIQFDSAVNPEWRIAERNAGMKIIGAAAGGLPLTHQREHCRNHSLGRSSMKVFSLSLGTLLVSTNSVREALVNAKLSRAFTSLFRKRCTDSSHEI